MKKEGAMGTETFQRKVCEENVVNVSKAIEADQEQDGVPSFSLGSSGVLDRKDSGLAVVHSCTVHLRALQQGNERGDDKGAQQFLEETTEKEKGSFKAFVSRAAEGVRKPFRPLLPTQRLLNKRYLLYLSADALQLFRPTGEGLDSSDSDSESGDGSVNGDGSDSGDGHQGKQSNIRRKAAAPIKKAHRLAGKLGDKLGGKISRRSGGSDAGSPGTSGTSELPTRPRVTAVPVAGPSESSPDSSHAGKSTTAAVTTSSPPHMAVAAMAGTGGHCPVQPPAVVRMPAQPLRPPVEVFPVDEEHRQDGQEESGQGADPSSGGEGGEDSDEDSEVSSAGSEDGVFTLGVALAQVTDVEQAGKFVQVSYTPNHPRRWTARKTSRAVARSIFFPIGYPVRSALRKDVDVRHYITGEQEDSLVEGGQWDHSFVMEADSQQEAEELHTAVTAALHRLWAALSWVDKGLPLDMHLAPMLITAEGEAPSLPLPSTLGAVPGATAAAPSGFSSGTQLRQGELFQEPTRLPHLPRAGGFPSGLPPPALGSGVEVLKAATPGNRGEVQLGEAAVPASAVLVPAAPASPTQPQTSAANPTSPPGHPATRALATPGTADASLSPLLRGSAAGTAGVSLPAGSPLLSPQSVPSQPDNGAVTAAPLQRPAHHPPSQPIPAPQGPSQGSISLASKLVQPTLMRADVTATTGNDAIAAGASVTTDFCRSLNRNTIFSALSSGDTATQGLVHATSAVGNQKIATASGQVGVGGAAGGVVDLGQWGQRREVICVSPGWCKRVLLPREWCVALSKWLLEDAELPYNAAARAINSHGAGAAKGLDSKEESGKEEPSAEDGPLLEGGKAGRGRVGLVLTVWLGGALGPMAVRLGGKELVSLCSGGGGRPIAVEASPLTAADGAAAKDDDGKSRCDRPRLLLHCCMTLLSRKMAGNLTSTDEQTGASPEDKPADEREGKGVAKGMQEVEQGVNWWNNLNEWQQGQASCAAGVALVLLLSWAQMLISSKASAVAVLQVVSFLALNLLGLASLSVMALFWPSSPPSQGLKRGNRRHTQPPLWLVAASSAVAVACFLQLLLPGHTPSVEILQRVSFLVLALAAITLHTLLPIVALSPSAAPDLDPERAQIGTCSTDVPQVCVEAKANSKLGKVQHFEQSKSNSAYPRWSLTLLGARIVRDGEMEGCVSPSSVFEVGPDLDEEEDADKWDVGEGEEEEVEEEREEEGEDEDMNVGKSVSAAEEEGALKGGQMVEENADQEEDADGQGSHHTETGSGQQEQQQHGQNRDVARGNKSKGGVQQKSKRADKKKVASNGKGPRPIPKNFKTLVKEHPDTLDENTAERFLKAYPSKHKAYSALKETAEVREKEGHSSLLDQPHPKFHTIKRHYLHGTYSYSQKAQCLVWIEKDGEWKKAWAGMQKEGVTEEDFKRHIVMVYDFNWNVIDPRPHPHGRSIIIVDANGVSMADASGQAFRVISRAGSLLNLYFPDRLHTAFVINTPSWFSMIWRMVSPMIAKETRDRIQIFSKKDHRGLQKELFKHVEPDCIPTEYGGTSTASLADSQFEQRLSEHINQRI